MFYTICGFFFEHHFIIMQMLTSDAQCGCLIGAINVMEKTEHLIFFPKSPPPSPLFDIMSCPIIWAKILSTLHSVYLQTSSFPILKCISSDHISQSPYLPLWYYLPNLSPDSYNTIFHLLLQFAPNSQVVLSTTVREIVLLLPCLKL